MWDGYEPDRLGTLTVYACHGLPLWSRERRQKNTWMGTGELNVYCQQPFEVIVIGARTMNVIMSFWYLSIIKQISLLYPMYADVSLH